MLHLECRFTCIVVVYRVVHCNDCYSLHTSYITLAYPYRFQSIITRRRLNVAVICSWLFITAAVVLVIIVKQDTFAYYFSTFVKLLLIFTVLFTWGWTYKLIARHRRNIQTTQTPSGHEFVQGSKILRSTLTAILVTSCVFVCYSCEILLNFYRMTSTWSVDHNVAIILSSLSLTLMFLNSLLNPCLLFWRNSIFRATAKNIFSGHN